MTQLQQLRLIPNFTQAESAANYPHQISLLGLALAGV
jgi:hypothetical protein